MFVHKVQPVHSVHRTRPRPHRNIALASLGVEGKGCFPMESKSHETPDPAARPTGFVVPTGDGRLKVDWRRISPDSLLVTNRLVTEITAMSSFARGRLLDIGCGTKPYAPLFAGRVTEHVGIDMPNCPHEQRETNTFASALDLPFVSQSFDSVLCTEVLEHVPEPWRAYEEIARVLRPGGRALVTTPFLYRVHEAPYDFYRYTEFAHRHLAARAGLEVEEIRTRGGYLTAVADMLVKGVRQTMALVCGLVGVRGAGTGWLGRRYLVAIQMPYCWLLRRENLNSRVYTTGYLVLLRKPGGGAPTHE